MKVMDVLAGCGAESSGGAKSNVEVTGLQLDSRAVKAGDLFFALPGSKSDGAQFAQDAVKAGAAAVVAEKKLELKVPVFVTAPGHGRKAVALAAANFYKKPAAELVLLGITGTNGKTTTTYLLESICAAGGATTGLIGTIQYKYSGRSITPSHTTPDPIALHKLLRDMVDAGTDTVVMEVSSHALAQDRVHGLTFRAAAFTNLTRDHLDYHRDLEEYFQAKRRLFSDYLSPGGVGVVNGDDTYAARLYNELRGQKRMAWKFSRLGNGEISAADVEMSINGTKATLKTPAGDIPVKSALVGPHNLENILAATGMALGAGYSRRDVQDGIERCRAIPGRMERVEAGGVTALVDYAHTDDALRRALESARAVGRGRVIVVFGCGGDRDKGKRPLMGQAAAEGADLAVVTSDNPRTEDPDDIISEILPGLEKGGLRRMSAGKAKAGEKGYLVEADRKAAIALAAQLAKQGDLIIIAGKGHEPYQEIDGERHPFDDRAVAEAALAAPRA
ncbi:MAG TPA: UDP-N-acetylmuramoyl-L-alanyl-D-glutamate--2,6-diaminopimelate ligase [Myxococcales bacterium]|jgi:UDP-N-acetylmuramoyl-L-alanyl-D-glutamate--2,6-diaminopimelate ligase|nr:UDP-N-acetylmuramoyl-L-alanyl-D-glutamate--2,6-diaminopimelate ligase [Myxococcales bacterium]